MSALPQAPLNARFRGFELSRFFNRSGCTVSARGNGSTLSTPSQQPLRRSAGIKPQFCGRSMPGKISITKDENGELQIDPAELHCIYPPLRSASMHGNEQLRLHQSPLLTPV